MYHRTIKRRTKRPTRKRPSTRVVGRAVGATSAAFGVAKINMYPKRTFRRRPWPKRRRPTKRRPSYQVVTVGASRDYRESVYIPITKSKRFKFSYRLRGAAIGVAQRNRAAVLGAARCDYSVALENNRYIRRR